MIKEGIINEMREKVYFVILHYQTLNETIDCVESIIENIRFENKQIIVVDNASPNQSGIFLKEYFEKEKCVHIIISNENLGFAKGNNLGFQYAKARNADFIVQVNSDTIFLDNYFLDKVVQIYNKKKYAVLGPEIISIADGEKQNPLVNNIFCISDVKYKIFSLNIMLFLSYFGMDIIMQNLLRKEDTLKVEISELEVEDNAKFILHGCCLIFSPLYIKNFDGMFENTFMYYEEIILYYLCRKNGLKMLFSNELKLYHRRNSSTKMTYKSKRKRRQLYYKQGIVSLKAFQKLLISDNQN